MLIRHHEHQQFTPPPSKDRFPGASVLTGSPLVIIIIIIIITIVRLVRCWMLPFLRTYGSALDDRRLPDQYYIISLHLFYHYDYYYYIRLMAFFPGQPG